MRLEHFKILIGLLSALEGNAILTASLHPAQLQPAQLRPVQLQPTQLQPAYPKTGRGLQAVLQHPVHPLQAPQHLLALLPAPIQAQAPALDLATTSAASGPRAIRAGLTQSTWEMVANALVGAHQPIAQNTAPLAPFQNQLAVETHTEAMLASHTVRIYAR